MVNALRSHLDNVKTILYLYFDVNTISNLPKERLEYFIERYSYSPIFRLLYLIKVADDIKKNNTAIDLENEISKNDIYFINDLWVKHIIEICRQGLSIDEKIIEAPTSLQEEIKNEQDNIVPEPIKQKANQTQIKTSKNNKVFEKPLGIKATENKNKTSPSPKNIAFLSPQDNINKINRVEVKANTKNTKNTKNATTYISNTLNIPIEENLVQQSTNQPTDKKRIEENISQPAEKRKEQVAQVNTEIKNIEKKDEKNIEDLKVLTADITSKTKKRTAESQENTLEFRDWLETLSTSQQTNITTTTEKKANIKKPSRKTYTETMARLYEKQNSREQAIFVYKKLILQNPGKTAVYEAKIKVLQETK